METCIACRPERIRLSTLGIPFRFLKYTTAKYRERMFSPSLDSVYTDCPFVFVFFSFHRGKKKGTTVTRHLARRQFNSETLENILKHSPSENFDIFAKEGCVIGRASERIRERSGKKGRFGIYESIGAMQGYIILNFSNEENQISVKTRQRRCNFAWGEFHLAT